MGKNNRRRRAEKHRQQGRWDRARQPSSTSGLGERELADLLLFDAAEAAEHGNTAYLESALSRLAALAASGDRQGSLVTLAMTGSLVTALRSAWEGGWQPADIVRAADKRLSRHHAGLAGQIIAAEARTSAGPGVAVPEPWAAQLEQVAAGASAPDWADPEQLRDGASLMGMLTHLPLLPCLLPPPSEWGRGRRATVSMPPPGTEEGRMLVKVRALLAKAESTDFEEEAVALTAKAQELMARYAIDQAMVSGGDSSEAPRGRRIGIDDPYALGRANLLAAVARANRCRSVWMDRYGFTTVFGFPSDLDIVDVLYTSLLVQAVRAMTAAGSVRDEAGRSRTRSFRQSFLISFSGRIGERLQAATTVATEEAAAVHGGALLPVLAGRSAAVEDAFAAMFPELVQTSGRVTNWDGWVAGRIAADLAHLGPEQRLLPGIAV